MARRRNSPIAAWLHRIMPATISGRLVASFALLTSMTVIVTVGLTILAVTLQGSVGRDERAVDVLHGLSAYVQTRTDSLRLALADAAADPALVAAFSSPGRFERESYAERLLGRSGAVALVAVDASGTVLAQSGDPGAVSTLRSLSEAASLRGGVIPFGDGLAFVASHRVASAGVMSATITAAMAFDAEEVRLFNEVFADAVLSVGPFTTPRGERVSAQTPATFRDVRIVDQSPVVVEATILGLDDRPAGTVRLEDTDMRLSGASTTAQTIAAVTGVIAIAISIGFGVWLSGVVRRPVDSMVEHVTTQGYLAAEGAPYAARPHGDEADLPIEFRELGAVFDDLLAHLSDRQAELKHAVQQAAYSEETLGIIVNESLEAKLVLEDGRSIIANPAAAVMVGQPSGVALDQSLTATFRGTTLASEDGSVLEPAELLEQALSRTVLVRLTRPDQPERWYSMQAVRHADDLHNRIVLTGRDITEERRLQSIRSEIVSLISHDLRSPLAVVIGYLDLLRRDLPEAERLRAIDSAKRNAGRMADLLEDLLSATRAEELLAPAALLPVSLAELAEEVVSSMGPTHAERELSLDRRCRPVVLGEERRLRQVLVNLVTNAFKYSPEDRPIVVRVSCVGERATLAVEDHGPGVPEEERVRVFERFARLEEGKARPGVGLGLYIVRIICENHGGSVHVDGTPGGGATLVVELPLAGISDGKGGIVMGTAGCVPAPDPSANAVGDAPGSAAGATRAKPKRRARTGPTGKVSADAPPAPPEQG